MKLLIRLAILLVAYSYFIGMFSAARTEVEAEAVSSDPTATSMRNHLQSAVADALEWTAHSLRQNSIENEVSNPGHDM